MFHVKQIDAKAIGLQNISCGYIKYFAVKATLQLPCETKESILGI